MLKTKEQWLMEGINYYNAKCYRECLEACNRAIQLDSKYARAYHGKALALVQQKEYASALKAYKKASQFAPENAKIHAEMAELFYLKGYYKESGQFYRIAIRLDSKFEAVYVKKSKELIDTAFSFSTRYPLTHHHLTINAFNKVLSFNPDDNVARSELKKIQGEVDWNILRQSASSFPSTNDHMFGGCSGAFNCRCSKCWEP